MKPVKILLVVSLLLTCVEAALAVDPIPAARDYRIAAGTNKALFHNKDLLEITVDVLNQDPLPVKLTPIVPEVVVEDNLAVAATLDEAPVNVEIKPNLPLVGFAKLIPLNQPPAVDTAGAEILPPVYRLPLLGSPGIPGHSTRIISKARILIGLAPAPDAPADEPAAVPAAADPIPAVGVFIAPHPGEYLLECHITTIDGAGLAVAQKIIRIAPRRPDPIANLIGQTNKTVTIINEKVTKDLEFDAQTNAYIKLNKAMIQTIMRYIMGIRPTTATTTAIQTANP